jgi:hypothetical protein
MNRPSKVQASSSSFTPSRSEDGKRSSRVDRIRLLIADDHMTVLAGLVSIINMQSDMMVVAEASNGRPLNYGRNIARM